MTKFEARLEVNRDITDNPFALKAAADLTRRMMPLVETLKVFHNDGLIAIIHLDEHLTSIQGVLKTTGIGDD
jgi:hypothetical protein